MRMWLNLIDTALYALKSGFYLIIAMYTFVQLWAIGVSQGLPAEELLEKFLKETGYVLLWFALFAACAEAIHNTVSFLLKVFSRDS